MSLAGAPTERVLPCDKLVQLIRVQLALQMIDRQFRKRMPERLGS